MDLLITQGYSAIYGQLVWYLEDADLTRPEININSTHKMESNSGSIDTT